MAAKKHSLFIVILTGIAGWIIGVNIGGRAASTSPECRALEPNPRHRRRR